MDQEQNVVSQIAGSMGVLIQQGLDRMVLASPEANLLSIEFKMTYEEDGEQKEVGKSNLCIKIKR